MIKTMLVEDERVLLEDLLTIINWQGEGFAIVATANNGKQGLRKYEQHLPELIITDIRMPVMDGLSMMKSIRRANPAVQFLILSAYSEFDYAKEALRMGAEDYILKTEISESYLKEKLNQIRISMANRTDMLYDATEKKLLSLISNPGSFCSLPDSQEPSPTDIADALDKIFHPLDTLPEEALLRQLVHFLLPAVQKQYDDMMLSDKYRQPSLKSLTDVRCWLMDEIVEIIHLKEMIFHHAYSPVIINAVDYIRQHYPDPDLKISLIADHIGLSSGRFSVLFKKEMGKTVNDFLTELRITEAKKLLSSGKYKVYEVTEMVGYRTSQYFSQIFYQYTGQYPNQYRRRLDQ